MALLNDIGNSLGNVLRDVGTTSAKAAAQANAVSAQAQSAQGAFNQASANKANALNENAMASQWAFNSGQATAANLNQMNMWQTAADWNEEMWERQAEYNAEQAEIQRQWQEKMANTQYQRAISDMSKAGLNPILAVTGGGVGTSVPGGATASVGGAQMSSAQANMASGGLLGANSANEGNYIGQMDYMSTTLALIGALFQNFSSAQKIVTELGDVAQSTSDALVGDQPNQYKERMDKTKKDYEEGNFLKGMLDSFQNMILDRPGGWLINNAAEQSSKKKGMTKQDEAQLLRYESWNNSTWKYTRPKG